MSKKITGASAIFMAAALLFFPRQAADGASAGISTCLGVLVPSLFPFLVITVFLVKSGLSSSIGRCIGKPFAKLFALPPAAAPAILMGMLGGYPTGSRGAQALYESGELNAEQAERLLLFSVNGGPAFICTAVGLGFLGSVQAGRFLLIVHLLSGLAVGILLGISHHKDIAQPPHQISWPSPAKALLAAVRSSASSMLLMCCFVVLFSTFLCILQQFFSGTSLAVFAGFCEVTLGCRSAANVNAPLWCISLILGWGGLCVHLQVLQGLSFRVRPGRFFLCRALQGGLAALCTLPFQNEFTPKPPLPPVVDVFGSFAQSRPELSGGIAAGAALIILCAALLIDSSGQHNSVV